MKSTSWKDQQNDFEWCQFKSFQFPKICVYDILTIKSLNAWYNVLHFDGKWFEADKQKQCHDIISGYVM